MSKLQDFKATLGSQILEGLARLVRPLPKSVRNKTAQSLGLLYGALPHQQKRALNLNLRRLMSLEGNSLKKINRAVFKNFALTLKDFFFPEDFDIQVPEKSRVEKLREKFGGVMILTFHMGNWEGGARMMRSWGWPVSAVYQPYENKHFKKTIESRRAKGVNFIPVGKDAAKGVINALKRGDVVAMLGDQPYGEEGTWVRLLGQTVKWPKGPILLAAKAKAPVVIAVIVRKNQNEYEALLEDPIYPFDRSKKGIQQSIQEVADKFGKLLVRFPTQWYRFEAFEFK